MTAEQTIIDFDAWLESPAGRYLLAWEQERLDLEVVDLFGFHALQVGMPALDALRSNRMPHRWRAMLPDEAEGERMAPPRADLACQAEALPFDTGSLDLVVLPHTLERAVDPHRALAEVDRVLRPEGRVVVMGFNPSSLWGVRQRIGRIRPGHAAGPAEGPSPLMPDEAEFIGYRRLRDWLRLLSFEVEGGRYGCYRPPMRSQRWLDRLEWMDTWGDRWWPVLGAVYCCVAVKRVRGMRLVGLARERRRAGARAAATAAAGPSTAHSTPTRSRPRPGPKPPIPDEAP